MSIFSMFLRAALLGFLALVTMAQTETTCQPGLGSTGTPTPQLKLKWGTWNASCYEHDNRMIQIFHFKNVRFGAVPERFGRSIRPDWDDDTVQELSQDMSCFQVDPHDIEHPPGGKPLILEPGSSEELQLEDCLYLDIYVPASAFQPEAKPLPVVVWFYGGAYAFGSKTPLGPIYTGQSILNASNYQTIFITGNYRLGAFGWLAGHYMQEVGQPNAGLYDQDLLLEWVQDYVHLVQGDKNHMSAWGESAGAGSILHHLIREDGKHDPLFNTFAVQSPAFQWAWDNSHDGELDTIFKIFSNLSDCGYDYNISCLRDSSAEKLEYANQILFNEVRLQGFFPVGPAVDGSWIKSIPAVSFSQGNHWPGIESAIISHCANEPAMFTPSNISTQEQFDDFINKFLPGESLENERMAIGEQYNCTALFDGDIQECISILIRDSMFTCNTRDLFEAYPKTSYMMQYTFPWIEYAFHATDLVPLFANNEGEVLAIAERVLHDNVTAEIYSEFMEEIHWIYKAYFSSFALHGDPNAGLTKPNVTWPVADGSSDKLSNVMNVIVSDEGYPEFELIEDDQNAKSICLFWTDLAKNLTFLAMDIANEEIVPLGEDSSEL